MTTAAARLIAIEGIDGSGKGTQAKLLCERLNREGTKAALLSFPQYDNTRFGKAIGNFLNGRFGELDQVDPFLVSLLYAGDRFESRDHLLSLSVQHQVVVLDRYVGSNLAHQGAKCQDDRREEILNWIQYIEFDLYQLPQVDMNILLNLPVTTAQQLILKKAARTYTDQATDLQEADGGYLSQVHQIYRQLAEQHDNWHTLECMSHDQLRTVDDIHEQLVQLVFRQL